MVLVEGGDISKILQKQGAANARMLKRTIVFERIFTAKAQAGCLPVLVGPRSLCVGTCGEIILRVVGCPTFREASA